MPSTRDEFRLVGGVHADEPSVAALVLELNDPGHERVQGVVLTLPDIHARLVLCAALADEDGAGVDQLPAKTLHSQPLAVRIAAVCRGAAAFLVCHDGILFWENLLWSEQLFPLLVRLPIASAVLN